MDTIEIECVHNGPRGRCATHGSRLQGQHCTTAAVLQAVSAERVNQYARYGTNAELLDGTGPDVNWVPFYPHTAKNIESVFREDYDSHDKPTWLRLVREEVAEAFQETDPARLEEELIQVAALAVSWVEKIRERTYKR